VTLAIQFGADQDDLWSWLRKNRGWHFREVKDGCSVGRPTVRDVIFLAQKVRENRQG